MSASWNCASASAKETVGRWGQKGGRRTASRFTSSLCISSACSIVLKSHQWNALIDGLVDYYHVLSVIRITSGVTNICGYAGGWFNIMTHMTLFNRVLIIQFNVKILLLLRHDSISPFTWRQCYSIYVTTILFHLRHGNISP